MRMHVHVQTIRRRAICQGTCLERQGGCWAALHEVKVRVQAPASGAGRSFILSAPPSSLRKIQTGHNLGISLEGLKAFADAHSGARIP